MTKYIHRYRVVEVSAELVSSFLFTGSTHHFKCTSGLPDGATFIRMFENPSFNPKTVFFVFEHHSFDIVEYGSLIPRMQISIDSLTVS